jgi:DNA anti-recombination protein RmuC
MATEIGDRRGEAITCFNLGNIWKNLQQKSEAKAAYQRARKLYQAIGLDKEVKDCDYAIKKLEEE